MSSLPTVYCIPGLGLDHRLFELLELPNAKIVALDWIEPLEEETIADYAKRFAEEKIPVEESTYLLGVSLGGIMSVEIARFRNIKKLYLISTLKNSSERPKYMAWLDKLPNQSKNAARFAIEASIALKPFYDKASQAGNELFHKMVKSASIDFINWGIRAIARWSFEDEVTTPYLHLHGTEDLVFPIKNIDHAVTIKGGTHFMIHNDAAKISKLIEQDLKL
ncbi:MAG: alpha/beta hydrolase [Vicingaceae bacterium]